MTAQERDTMAYLRRSVNRQIGRNAGAVKSNMELLTTDFNENFAGYSEHLYKGNIKLEWLNGLDELICDAECTIEAVRYWLNKEAERAAQEILNTEPFYGSSNGAANLCRRWEYETTKEIYVLAKNWLCGLSLDEE